MPNNYRIRVQGQAPDEVAANQRNGLYQNYGWDAANPGFIYVDPPQQVQAPPEVVRQYSQEELYYISIHKLIKGDRLIALKNYIHPWVRNNNEPTVYAGDRCIFNSYHQEEGRIYIIIDDPTKPGDYIFFKELEVEKCPPIKPRLPAWL